MMLDSGSGPALLATLASPRRQEILRLVWEQERSAGDIARAMPDVTFGAVSLAGLVDVRTDSRNRFYRARREAIGPLADHLERMWGDALWRLKNAAELEHSRRGPRPRRKRPGTRKN